MNFTLSQQEAIEARGDTLVMAGAGTGKTRVSIALVDVLQRVEFAHFSRDPRREVRCVELRDRTDPALARQ